MKMYIAIAALLLPSQLMVASEIPDACDFEHQCYHMDPKHPDLVTPPPAPQYPTVKPQRQPIVPQALMPSPQIYPSNGPGEDPNDPRSCFNLRRGIFPTPDAAAQARARCGDFGPETLDIWR